MKNLILSLSFLLLPNIALAEETPTHVCYERKGGLSTKVNVYLADKESYVEYVSEAYFYGDNVERITCELENKIYNLLDKVTLQRNPVALLTLFCESPNNPILLIGNTPESLKKLKSHAIVGLGANAEYGHSSYHCHPNLVLE